MAEPVPGGVLPGEYDARPTAALAAARAGRPPGTARYMTDSALAAIARVRQGRHVSRPSQFLCRAGLARAEIQAHLLGQGCYIAALLVADSDLVVGEHRGQVLQR